MQIDHKINSKQLREMLGGISDMSLWRFVHSKYLDFPKPTYINKRRFWSSRILKTGLENSLLSKVVTDHEEDCQLNN